MPDTEEPRNRSYILAERPPERMGIAMVNFYDLWRDAHGPHAIPGVKDCEDYITDFLANEVLAVKWATIEQIMSMRDVNIDKLKHDTARDKMLANAGVEKKLLLKHL